MMKKFVVVGIVLVSVSSGAWGAGERAAEVKAAAEARRAEVRANVQERRQEVKSNIEARHEEVKENVDARRDTGRENRIQRISTARQTVQNHLNRRLDRINAIRAIAQSKNNTEALARLDKLEQMARDAAARHTNRLNEMERNTHE